MSGDGREEHLAPVTDLFTRRTTHAAESSPNAPAARLDEAEEDSAPDVHDDDRYDADGWYVDASAASEPRSVIPLPQPDADAPIPLPTARASARSNSVAQFPAMMRASDLLPGESSPAQGEGGASSASAGDAERTRQAAPIQLHRADESAPRRGRIRPIGFVASDEMDDEGSEEEQRGAGEAALLKRLRTRGMSIAESRAFLRGMDISTEVVDELIDLFLDRRYLDDAVLAEQLVYSAVSKKSQGKRAIAQALSARGIERDVVEAALADLADDDEEERALEFARTKARSMSKLEHEVALRRLVGQLARRGFAGSLAMRAAKTALDEVTGVRFR